MKRLYEHVAPIEYKTTKAQRAASARRYAAKREELREYWRTLPPEKREERNRRSREWKERNKDRLRSPRYKIVKIVLCRFHRYNIKPLASAEALLGCSVREFIAYIEAKMRPGMTWENHGRLWHLDHIKPFEQFNIGTL